MSYSIIQQLLSQGLNGEEVLALLMRNSPRIARKAQKLLGGGWGVNEVLDLFNKDPNENRKHISTNRSPSPEEVAALQAHKGRMQGSMSRDEQSRQRLMRFTKGAASLAGSALGSYALSRVLPAAAGTLLPPTPGPSPTQPETPPTPPTPTQPMPPTPPTPTQPEIPPIPNQEVPKQVEDISKSSIQEQFPGEIAQIDRMKEAGNGPNEMLAYFKYFFPASIKNVEKASGKDFLDFIMQRIQETPTGHQKKEPEPKENIQSTQSPEPAVSEQPSIEKRPVLLPGGEVGQVQSVKNGIGKILNPVNGQERHIKLEELPEIPISTKDLGDLAEELDREVERHTGQQISRHVSLASYDPIKNALLYIPHEGSESYVFTDIGESRINKLTSLLTERKSTGENYIGQWVEGSPSPIGAEMHQLLTELRQEGKVYTFKFHEIYDANRPVKEAKKAKFKKRREDEKRKKRESKARG